MMPVSDTFFDSEKFERLINKYNLSGPRYTSYPTAVQFDPHTLPDSRIKKDESGLSLYFHIPFCSHLCYYCACNKIVTKVKDKANTYLHYLKKEIRLRAENQSGKPLVKQLHFGGGTPTFLSAAQLRNLLDYLKQYYLLDSKLGEYSIEIDPRECNEDYLSELYDMGFNRLSFGIQDFEKKVQMAVHRVQPYDKVEPLITHAKALGFRSLNFDLIYGLPYQTVNSFTKTLETVVSLSPDRLSIFNYAHLPHLFSPQKRISIDTLPLPSEKIAILSATTNYLLEHGYVFIGMDHFAKPDDSLVTSLNEGKLHRNFQGYTTHPGSALIGYGVSSISQYATGYSQNYKTLDAYYSALDDNKLPTWRGCNVSREDDLRKDIIMSLICNFHLSFEDINQKYHIKFNQKFQPELLELKEFESEGLIRIGENSIDVTSLGRFFIRNICMVFDAYLPHAHEKTYSKVI
tara:strand:+ start:10016 stop:11395 length:1380 start_codon:yes stop_codon:yes gene_type:complete